MARTASADRCGAGEYLADLEARFREVGRVLSPTGSLFVAIGLRYQAEVGVLLKRLGLHWRNTICWHYTFGPGQRRKLTPSWVAIHWFTHDRKRFTFNADAVRISSTRQRLGDK